MGSGWMSPSIVCPLEESAGCTTKPLFEGLPDDIALRCLARVPRADHKALRATCRAWARLLRGDELFKAREADGVREEWLYVLAGARGCKSLRIEAFDPRQQPPPCVPSEIAVHPDPPFTLHGCSVAGLGGEIFVLGGSIGSEAASGACPTARVWSYHVLSRVWKERPPMLSARCNFACVVVQPGPGGVGPTGIVVAGGWNQRREPLSAAEIFCPETDTWKPLASMNRSRANCQATVLGGAVIVLGGIDRRVNVGTTTTLTLICGEILNFEGPGSPLTEDMKQWGAASSSGLQREGLAISQGVREPETSEEHLLSVEDGWSFDFSGRWHHSVPGAVDSGGGAECSGASHVTSSWKRIEGMWRNISLPGSLVVLDGQLLAVADIAGNLQQYIPETNAWEAVCSIPYPQRGSLLACLNGGLLLMGVYGGHWLAPQKHSGSDHVIWDGLAPLYNEVLAITTVAL